MATKEKSVTTADVQEVTEKKREVKKTGQLLLELNEELEEERRLRKRAENLGKRLQTEVKELSDAQEALESDLKKQLLDAKKLKRQLDDEYAANSKLTSEVALLEEKLALTKAKGGGGISSNQLKGAKEALKEREDQIEEYRKHAAATKKKHDAAIQELQDALDEQRRLYDREIKTKARFRQEMTELNALVSRERGLQVDVKTAETLLRKQHEDLRARYEAAQAQLAALESDKKEVEKYRFRMELDLKRKTEEAQERERGMQRSLDLWIGKTKTKAQTEEQLSAEKMKLQKELAQMEERYAKANEDFRRQKEEYLASMEVIRQKNDEREEKRRKQWELDEAKRAREEQLLKTLKVHAEEETSTVKARLKEEMKKLQREKDEERHKLDEDRDSDRAQWSRLRERLESDLADRQIQIDELKLDVADLQAEKKDLEESLRRLRASEASVSDELELERDENAKKLRDTHEQLKKKRTQYEKKKVKLTKALATLKITETELTATKSELELTKDELQKTRDDLTTQLNTTRQNLRDEMETRWKLEETRDRLEGELMDVKWYFLPLEEQLKQKSKDPEFNLFRRMRDELKSECEEFARMHRKITIKNEAGEKVQVPDKDLRRKTLSELQGDLIDALEALDDDVKEAYAEVLGSLMQAMEMLTYSLKTKLLISVALTSGKVQPELLYELIEIAEYVLENLNVTIFETPEGIVMHIIRIIREQEKYYQKKPQFNDLLLDRLVFLRARRTGKPEEFSRIQILEGVEE